MWVAFVCVCVCDFPQSAWQVVYFALKFPYFPVLIVLESHPSWRLVFYLNLVNDCCFVKYYQDYYRWKYFTNKCHQNAKIHTKTLLRIMCGHNGISGLNGIIIFKAEATSAFPVDANRFDVDSNWKPVYASVKIYFNTPTTARFSMSKIMFKVVWQPVENIAWYSQV